MDEKKKVMLIDDSEAALAFTAQVLEEAGYQVKSVLIPSKDEGSLGYSVSRYEPDLILCDVNMPFLKGSDFVRILKNSPIYGRIKVILYSVKPSEELEVLMKASLADGYISKSNNTDELLKRVRELVGKR